MHIFYFSIHPPEHFKKKYEVDEVFFTDEVYFYLIFVYTELHMKKKPVEPLIYTEY